MSRFKFDLSVAQPSTGVEHRSTQLFRMISLWNGDEYELTLYDHEDCVVERFTHPEHPTYCEHQAIKWLVDQAVAGILSELKITPDNGEPL